MKKRLAPNSVTQTPCCTKDESHPLFHQSVTKLTKVKLDFDQIRTMTCVSSGFRCSLLFLALFVTSQTLAKPGNSANSTPVSSTATKQCNNVYNSFYAGTNKKIETLLQEMKEQLTQVQDDIEHPEREQDVCERLEQICLCVEICFLIVFQWDVLLLTNL